MNRLETLRSLERALDDAVRLSRDLGLSWVLLQEYHTWSEDLLATEENRQISRKSE